MNLRLIRTNKSPTRVFGELWDDNGFLCYTLEDPERLVKIKHETCIPKGKYQVIINKSPRFKVEMPLLLNVPNFLGIRIHTGNTTGHTSGCILVGNKISGDKILNSTAAYLNVFAKIKAALKVGKVTIEILDKQDVIEKPVQILPAKISFIGNSIKTNNTLMENKNLNTLFPAFVGVNLDLIKDSVVPQIDNDTVEAVVISVIEKLKQTALIVTDDNPDNKEQLKVLWSGFTSEPDVIKSFEQLFAQAINKVEDAKVKEGLTLIAPEIVSTLVAVSDTNPENGKQIEAIWKKFALSKGFIDYLVSNVKFILDKFKLPTWLKNIIERLTK